MRRGVPWCAALLLFLSGPIGAQVEVDRTLQVVGGRAVTTGDVRRARVLKRAINGDAERVGARLGIDRDQRALEPCGGQPSQNHVAERARIGRTKDGDRLRIEEGAEARGVAERVVVHGGERAGTA